MKPTGELYLYRGNGTGGWITGNGELIGTGFDSALSLVSAGDFSGDGAPDLLAVRAGGSLYMYRSDGAGGWISPNGEQIGSGWSFQAIAAPGDFSGDGKADLLAVTSSGQLLVYRGNGAGGFITGNGEIVGTGGWGALRVLSGPGTRWYPTAQQYGGANATIDTGGEAASLASAMAGTSDAGRQRLWAGLDKASRDFYVNALLPDAQASRQMFGLDSSAAGTRAVFADPRTHRTIVELGTPLTSAEHAFVSDEGPPSWVYDGAPDANLYVTEPYQEGSVPPADSGEPYPGELDGASGQDSVSGAGCDPTSELGCPAAGATQTYDAGTTGTQETDDLDAAAATVTAQDALAAGAARGFSRYGAVADANAHATTPRTGLFSPVGDADCTNFVSQVWHLGGGLPMKRGWYIRWETRWFPVPHRIRVSSYSWTLVRNFVDYMVNVRQTSRLIFAAPSSAKLPSGTGLADAVEYDWGMGHGWSHLAVVVGLSGDYDRISQHSTNRRASSWRRGWFDQTDPTIRARMRTRVVHLRAR